MELFVTCMQFKPDVLMNCFVVAKIPQLETPSHLFSEIDNTLFCLSLLGQNKVTKNKSWL